MGAESIASRPPSATLPGRLTGQDWRRPDLQERYRGFFSWYLARKIERLR